MTDDEKKAQKKAKDLIAATVYARELCSDLEQRLMSRGYPKVEAISMTLNIFLGGLASYTTDGGASPEDFAEYLEGTAEKFRSGGASAFTTLAVARARGEVPS